MLEEAGKAARHAPMLVLSAGHVATYRIGVSIILGDAGTAIDQRNRRATSGQRTPILRRTVDADLRRGGLLNIAVDVAAIANGQDPHNQLTVLDGLDDAVVADPEAPAGTVPLKGPDIERRGGRAA
ncbi:hypothetical protein [Nonomuraea turcica]|uniref:hypothetical protein n=1 Tax=Nonomuraea sp. G32 TaxID=3067274 RepID=UPI00273CB249|nr:hypothetical protein [Nonomuraea sp. G32]MDP4501304.1 hypothetical protein [Nonomuraea sp. G32]